MLVSACPLRGLGIVLAKSCALSETRSMHLLLHPLLHLWSFALAIPMVTAKILWKLQRIFVLILFCLVLSCI